MSLLLWGQDLSQDFKHWYIFNLNTRLSKANTLTVGHLSSFDKDAGNYQHGFTQHKLVFSHRLNKKWTASAGYAHSVIKRSNNSKLTYHRVQMAITHRQRFGNFRMDNTLQLEKYIPTLQKFGARAVVTNKWRYVNKKLPLRASPYIKQQLFYYQGGSPITYWLPGDEFEEGGPDFIENAPNGWHRYRFTAGLRVRLAKNLYSSVFYTLQREFNTGLAPYRELNVSNKSGTRIKRAFNNYALLGVSLSYTLDARQK